MSRAMSTRAMEATPSFRSLMYAYVQAFLKQVLVSVACNGAFADPIPRGCARAGPTIASNRARSAGLTATEIPLRTPTPRTRSGYTIHKGSLLSGVIH
jgi:hypothetical protein